MGGRRARRGIRWPGGGGVCVEALIWPLCAHPAECAQLSWLSWLNVFGTVPFISAVGGMRLPVGSLLQPRQLRADIPSKTCEGG